MSHSPYCERSFCKINRLVTSSSATRLFIPNPPNFWHLESLGFISSRQQTRSAIQPKLFWVFIGEFKLFITNESPKQPESEPEALSKEIVLPAAAVPRGTKETSKAEVQSFENPLLLETTIGDVIDWTYSRNELDAKYHAIATDLCIVAITDKKPLAQPLTSGSAFGLDLRNMIELAGHRKRKLRTGAIVKCGPQAPL
ncbi:MAG: hypothetical protein ABR976_04595 [Terracidiphilus sp.]|jgi:hypothetical protein